MATSFLRPQTIDRLANAVQRGHATKLAMQGGGTSLVLGRWVGDNLISQPAQTVTVEFANQQERTSASDSARATFVDGWFAKLAPFNVEVGDVFTIGETGDEMSGAITVVQPAKLGVQRAGFTLRLSEALP